MAPSVLFVRMALECMISQNSNRFDQTDHKWWQKQLKWLCWEMQRDSTCEAVWIYGATDGSNVL